jgi:hypothetical protein
MGLDYIRRETGKPWRKRWNGGLDRLKTPTLLDLTISDTARVVTAELTPGAQAKVGDSVIVECSADGFTITDGLRPIGRVANPTAEATAAVAACSGYAEGVVQRIGLFGDIAELSLK